MMGKVRKSYSAQFKAQVALSAIREDAPISELASKYGVHAKVIQRWKREALASMELGFSSKLEKEKTDHAAEVKELHAKIGQLTVERDFLSEASSRLSLGGAKKW